MEIVNFVLEYIPFLSIAIDVLFSLAEFFFRDIVGFLGWFATFELGFVPFFDMRELSILTLAQGTRAVGD